MVQEQELQHLIDIKPGETFSRAKMTEITKQIGERLGQEGYAFANVNTVPQVNDETKRWI